LRFDVLAHPFLLDDQQAPLCARILNACIGRADQNLGPAQANSRRGTIHVINFVANQRRGNREQIQGAATARIGEARVIFIDNQTVAKVLTMEDTLRAIENGHQELARGELAGRPRLDVYTETRRPETFHRWGTMEGSSKSLQRFAIRMKSDVVSWPVKHGIKVEDKYCVKPGLYWVDYVVQHR
jgi:hypothetical protein